MAGAVDYEGAYRDRHLYGWPVAPPGVQDVTLEEFTAFYERDRKAREKAQRGAEAKAVEQAVGKPAPVIARVLTEAMVEEIREAAREGARQGTRDMIEDLKSCGGDIPFGGLT